MRAQAHPCFPISACIIGIGQHAQHRRGRLVCQIQKLRRCIVGIQDAIASGQREARVLARIIKDNGDRLMSPA